MIKLTYKQIGDLYYLSSKHGGTRVELDPVYTPAKGQVLYAYVKNESWLLPPYAKMRQVPNE